MNAYKFISTNFPRTLHLGEGYGIRTDNSASFIALDIANYYEALNRDAYVLLSLKNGCIIAESKSGSHATRFR